MSEQQSRLLEIARSKSVYICTPIARHPCRQYSMALSQTLIYLAQLGIPAFVQNVVGNSNLPRARNELVASFLASNYSDLLFWDDDEGVDRGAVLRLLASDKPVIGAVGPKKRIMPDRDPNKWCVRVWKDRPMKQDDLGNIEVEAVGTGFLKIERGVFEKMIEAHPDWKRTGWKNMPEDARAKYYRFFRFDSDDPDEIGEDFDFCRSWAALGGEIWVDPTIKIIHVGEMEFTGDFQSILEPAEQEGKLL